MRVDRPGAASKLLPSSEQFTVCWGNLTCSLLSDVCSSPRSFSGPPLTPPPITPACCSLLECLKQHHLNQGGSPVISAEMTSGSLTAFSHVLVRRGPAVLAIGFLAMAVPCVVRIKVWRRGFGVRYASPLALLSHSYQITSYVGLSVVQLSRYHAGCSAATL